MPTVQVEGLGNVQFPDGMAPEEMTQHIQNALAEKNTGKPMSGQPDGGNGVPDTITGNTELANKVSLWEGLKGAAKGAIGNINSFDEASPLHAFASTPKLIPMNTESTNPDQTAGKVAEAGVEMALPMLKGAEALPSASRAGGVLDSVANAAKDVHVPLNQASAPLQRVTELGERGGTLPTSANALLKRSQGLEAMTFPEARDYYSNISSLSGDEANKLNPVMKKAVGALKGGFHGDLTDAAGQVGMGEDYANAMKEYANAMRMRDLGKTALTKVLPAGGALGAIGYAADKLRGH